MLGKPCSAELEVWGAEAPCQGAKERLSPGPDIREQEGRPLSFHRLPGSTGSHAGTPQGESQGLGVRTPGVSHLCLRFCVGPAMRDSPGLGLLPPDVERKGRHRWWKELTGCTCSHVRVPPARPPCCMSSAAAQVKRPQATPRPARTLLTVPSTQGRPSWLIKTRIEVPARPLIRCVTRPGRLQSPSSWRPSSVN